MDVDGMVAEIEEIIRTKGLVAYDGQVITSLRRVGPWDEWFEPSSIDTPLHSPKRRHWDTNNAPSSASSSHTRWPTTRAPSPIPASRQISPIRT
jgi:hypothetical protein